VFDPSDTSDASCPVAQNIMTTTLPSTEWMCLVVDFAGVHIDRSFGWDQSITDVLFAASWCMKAFHLEEQYCVYNVAAASITREKGAVPRLLGSAQVMLPSIYENCVITPLVLHEGEDPKAHLFASLWMHSAVHLASVRLTGNHGSAASLELQLLSDSKFQLPPFQNLREPDFTYFITEQGLAVVGAWQEHIVSTVIAIPGYVAAPSNHIRLFDDVGLNMYASVIHLANNTMYMFASTSTSMGLYSVSLTELLEGRPIFHKLTTLETSMDNVWVARLLLLPPTGCTLSANKRVCREQLLVVSVVHIIDVVLNGNISYNGPSFSIFACNAASPSLQSKPFHAAAPHFHLPSARQLTPRAIYHGIKYDSHALLFVDPWGRVVVLDATNITVGPKHALTIRSQDPSQQCVTTFHPIEGFPPQYYGESPIIMRDGTIAVAEYYRSEVDVIITWIPPNTAGNTGG
jgi:hypothetical protein